MPRALWTQALPCCPLTSQGSAEHLQRSGPSTSESTSLKPVDSCVEHCRIKRGLWIPGRRSTSSGLIMLILNLSWHTCQSNSRVCLSICAPVEYPQGFCIILHGEQQLGHEKESYLACTGCGPCDPFTITTWYVSKQTAILRALHEVIQKKGWKLVFCIQTPCHCEDSSWPESAP